MSALFDLVCLSHLRWDFVYQRPQHLLSRFGRQRRVFFVEEPVFGAVKPSLHASERSDNVQVLVPHLPGGRTQAQDEADQHALLQKFFTENAVSSYVFWYYTPMAIGYTEGFSPKVVVYDCMDELSAFSGASPQLREREQELFDQADLVFTGGQSLYESKKTRHERVFAFPSSVDAEHFRTARTITQDPADQAAVAHPRLGFFGVIDERFDVPLLTAISKMRPDWQFVIIGPVVKIDPATLPHSPNVHYLGGKSYQDLPGYLSGWDVALLLFARNESTRFISPTKTPEYLAAGCPVVSTSIRDVVRPYGEQGLARIADTPEEFVAACAAALSEKDDAVRLAKADQFLAQMSWDRTWARMNQLVEEALDENQKGTISHVG